jgi:acyl-coenzyme A synthetase/AMP-(fatty) acid ligase
MTRSYHRPGQRVRTKLASYKQPRRLWVVDELPRVPNGRWTARARTVARSLIAERDEATQ